MKTNFRFLALSAAILSMFTACQREELEQNQKPEALTHSVTFVAGAPETKTTVDISDGKTAKFKWTKADEGRFTVYENGTKAKETVGVLNVDTGIMSLMATFDGKRPESASYVAVVYKSSNATQIMSAEAYDEDADILVSKAVSSFDGENGVQLQFKREVAIAKMTLKGLDAGEVVNIVTVSSTADIAGSYGVDGWASPAKTSLEISSASYMGETDGYSIVANESGEAVVWFTCIPQDAATLTVKVQAADGDTYTKEFSRAITLTRGDVKGFGVEMVKDDLSLSFNFKTHPSGWPTSSAAASSAADYVYTLNGVDYKFSCPAKAYCGGTSETSGYLLIQSSTSMGLPALSGYKLTKVVGTLNDSGTPSTSSSISITDGENVVSGGTAQTWSTKGAEYTYSLTDTEENQVYYFTVSNKNCQMIKLVLTYEPAIARTNLATPTNLAVSAEKAVSWGIVDGAASYVLTIGTEEYLCTSNSYDASAIADEYYDVAVVAVPTDTENYKNSAAATLTDAKFGTPTLATPTLAEGAVDEFSVNATWTVDSRATAGYNCELYNGETKVGDSKTVTKGSVTFDGLDDGVTYTVKVNAIAVEGTKAYAASAVATIDLTTTPASKVSDVTAADTYTIKNLTVYAVPNISLAILGDATGYILYYVKGGHGLSVGNTLDVAGPVVDYYGLWEFSGATASNVKTGSTPDYGEPVEATNEFLASFATKPLIKYIHAVGEQSGQDITVGENKLHLSAANSATEGKTVSVYGFTYGYHSTNKYVQFVATSIAEDPTAPKLSVTPTSKTWASNETDAAVFTVTTNAEGENGWSISQDKLDWATVDVNNANGIITVTPNGKNEGETANEGTITVTHSADNSLKETITLIQKSSSQNESYEVSGTLASWSFTSSSYPANKTNYANNGSDDLATGTFYLNGTGATWHSTKGYAFTAVTDITITVTATKALKKGSKITFSMDTYYNKASNAPMKGFNLTAAEGKATSSTTGLSVTSFTLSNSSATKSVDYTLQNDVSAGSTVKLILTQTGNAGSGQGYINNIKAKFTAK